MISEIRKGQEAQLIHKLDHRPLNNQESLAQKLAPLFDHQLALDTPMHACFLWEVFWELEAGFAGPNKIQIED